MSLFGTLRRKGKKVDELKKPSVASASLSTSTPNLHNVHIRVPNVTLGHSSGDPTLDHLEIEDEFEDRSQIHGGNGRLERHPSSGSSISSASASTSSTLPRRKKNTGGLMSFWSMVSVNNTKRRNGRFGSAVHLSKPSSSPEPNSTVFYTQSQSAPNIDHHKHNTPPGHPDNMDPGILSSSSSSTGSFDTKLCKTEAELEHDKLMLQGIKKFNQDPKRGIDFLILNGIIERTPESVAQYLKDGEGLSKSAVGNYLGEHHDFNIQVLHAFVSLHDFTDVLLVQALRQFLWSFRLPGEAQKIDRMMESFAQRYCQLNPNIFKNPDTCYVLSYAIIMLNTSLHNPNVKDKPSVEQFIRMNRDIDGGDALSTNFMVQLYNSIQVEPFQIPPEDGNDLMLTFFNPDIEGWLWKQGESYKRWKRRWFILSNNCLYYFRFTTDKVPRGIIPLENIVVRTEKIRQFSFSLRTEDSRLDFIKSCKTLDDGQTVPGRHSAYHLATSSLKERDRWMTAISQNSSTHSFYTFLAQKKRNLTVKKRTTTKKSTVRKSQIGLPSFPRDDPRNAHATRELSEGLDSDNENQGHSGESAVSDATSQLSFEVRRYSEMDDEPQQGSSSAELTRKYSLPGHHRVSRYESMVMPEIRVTTPRDGVQDFHEYEGSDNKCPISKSGVIDFRDRACSESVVPYSRQINTKTESTDSDLSDTLDKVVKITHESENSSANQINHENTSSNEIKPYKTSKTYRRPKLPLLSLPKFAVDQSIEDKSLMSATPKNILNDSQITFESENTVRYFTKIPETTEIAAESSGGDTTPYLFEFPTAVEKLESRVYNKVIPPEDVGVVSEIRPSSNSNTTSRSRAPHFPVRRISAKIKENRNRRRSIDKIKIFNDDSDVIPRRRRNTDSPRTSDILSSPDICTSDNYFGTPPTSPSTAQIVETCNSVLINSVRHTDV